MTHFPRCSDAGSHVQKKKLPNNYVYFWERNSGFMVSALPKRHATAQAEAEEQGHDVGAQVTDQQPDWQQQLPTGTSCGRPGAEDGPLLYWLQSRRWVSNPGSKTAATGHTSLHMGQPGGFH